MLIYIYIYIYIYIFLSLKLSQKDEPGMWNTAGEARMKSSVKVSYGPRHIDVPVFDDQEEHIYKSSV